MDILMTALSIFFGVCLMIVACAFLWLFCFDEVPEWMMHLLCGTACMIICLTIVIVMVKTIGA